MPRPHLIAYLKARLLSIAWIPAISPYLRHGCMAGYPYLMPMASAAQRVGTLGTWQNRCKLSFLNRRQITRLELPKFLSIFISWNVLEFYKVSFFCPETLQSDFPFVLYSAIFATKSNHGRKYHEIEKEYVTYCASALYAKRPHFSLQKWLFQTPKSPETTEKNLVADSPAPSDGVSVRA